MTTALDAVNCTIMVRARLLAGWVGAGRPVTAKGVLRPADIPAAAAAIGVETPPKARTAADVGVLHRPWIAGQAMGFIAVDAARATATAAPAGDQLEAWWTALLAVLRAESHDRRGEGAVVLCQTLLAVLEDEPPVDELEDRVDERLQAADPWQFGAVFDAFRRGVLPVDGGLEVLAEFGAVDAAARLTALGRWAGRRFAATTPPPVTPDLPASELLTRLAPQSEPDALRQAQRWLVGRDIDEAVAEVLIAAEAGTPAARLAGIDLVGALGEAMRPAWQAALERPMLAPHARAALATWDAVEDEWEPSEADRSWLAVEYALAVEDPEERYHLVQDFGGRAVVDASGHPGAPGLRDALAAAGRPPQRVYQLKIVLSGVTPPVWRRLRVPASIPLDVLHHAIQAAFDWDDDHLHTFNADRRRYSDPDFALDDCDDESDVRLAKAMPREGATMTYVYDLGDYWEHRILVEKIDELADSDAAAITCTDGRGDAPIEDWHPEDGEGYDAVRHRSDQPAAGGAARRVAHRSGNGLAPRMFGNAPGRLLMQMLAGPGGCDCARPHVVRGTGRTRRRVRRVKLVWHPSAWVVAPGGRSLREAAMASALSRSIT